MEIISLNNGILIRDRTLGILLHLGTETPILTPSYRLRNQLQIDASTSFSSYDYDGSPLRISISNVEYDLTEETLTTRKEDVYLCSRSQIHNKLREKTISSATHVLRSHLLQLSSQEQDALLFVLEILSKTSTHRSMHTEISTLNDIHPTTTTLKKIAIVAHELKGITKNGGIGTFNHNLALLLSQEGHEVSIIFSPLNWPSTLHLENNKYQENGINFIKLEVNKGNVDSTHSNALHSKSLLNFFHSHTYDTVFCPDHSGIAYDSIVAHRFLNLLPHTQFITVTHGSTKWCENQSKRNLKNWRQIETYMMERGSVRFADLLISPSNYMLRWWEKERLQLPQKTFSIPYPILNIPSAPLNRSNNDEVCFFGRLEVRKGIDLFCDAIDILNEKNIAPPQITFLGRSAKVRGKDSIEYIQERALKWTSSIKILKDLDSTAAISYINNTDPFIVMPSRGDNSPHCVYEVASLKLRLCATNSGGVPEILDSTKSLSPENAESIASYIQNRMHASRPSLKARQKEVLRAWSQIPLLQIKAPQEKQTSSIAIISGDESPNKEAIKTDAEYLLLLGQGIIVKEKALQTLHMLPELATGSLAIENQVSNSTHIVPACFPQNFPMRAVELQPRYLLVKKSLYLEAGGLRSLKNNAISDLLLRVSHIECARLPLEICVLESDIELQDIIAWDSYTLRHREIAKLSLLRKNSSKQRNVLEYKDALEFSKVKERASHCFSITPESVSELKSYVGESVLQDPETATFYNIKPPFLFCLPPIQSKTILSIKANLKTEEESFLRIFYLPNDAEDFSIDYSITKPIPLGASETYVSIDTSNTKEDFLIEFGAKSKTTQIDAIEFVSD